MAITINLVIPENLTYEEGKQWVKAHCIKDKNGERLITQVYPGLQICYPGKKESGDYILFVHDRVLKHSDICVILVSYIYLGKLTYDEAIDLLEDVCRNGCKNDESVPDEIKAFTRLLFWATLQEEINYPQPRFEGRRMSFKRYAEAALSTRKDSPLKLKEVMERADDYRLPKNNSIDFPNKPSFYY